MTGEEDDIRGIEEPDPPPLTDPPKATLAKLACQGCGRVILDLALLDLKPDSVIVIKNCRETGKVEHLRRWLGANGWWGVLVIDMQGDQSLEILPEGRMAAAGWERVKGKRKAAGELGG